MIFEKKQNKSQSLTNYNQQFTAIGHLSLVFFLIQAVDSKLINSAKSSISLIHDPQKVANIEYTNLIAELCPSHSISIINPSSIRDNEYEPNFKLWPSLSKEKYLIARHHY